jgi:ComF family protein
MLKSLFNLLYPKTCCGCTTVLLESENELCTTCRHEMPFTRHCLSSDNETMKKFAGRLPLEHASSMVYFHKEGIVQEMIHNLKYRGRQEVSELMGQWYLNDLKKVEALQSVTDVVPVPLHPKRLRERGYNQIAGFGKAIADGLGASYNDSALRRAKYTKTQTKKNLEARAEIHSAFAIEHKKNLAGRHFLLVDDVITTGATLEACGRALLSIPGAKLSIVTIAYAHS